MVALRSIFFLESIILLNMCYHPNLRLDFRNLSYMYSEINGFIFNVYVQCLEISTSKHILEQHYWLCIEFINKIFLIEGTKTVHRKFVFYKLYFTFMGYNSTWSWNQSNECNEACFSAGMLRTNTEISVCL